MNRYLMFLVSCVFSIFTIAQNYEIDQYNGQTITTCTGTFYDSGGGTGVYSPGENYTVTFCPSTPGMSISFDFTYFSLSSGDALQVYNGTSTLAPSFGTFGDVFSPVGMGVAASATNSTGCLTFEFTSTGSDVGWVADVSCNTPCQTVHAGLQSSSPTAVNNYIDICPGDFVTFTGTGIYLENNVVYTQNDATSTFYWDFGNGQVDSVQTVTMQYDSIAGYNVDLTVVDINGCVSSNDLGIRVRVATTPTFDGTTVSDPVICHGDSTVLIGQVNPVEWETSAELALAGTTFLPDGSGASYSTSLLFDVFAPGQTLQNANDIVGICAVMEHSYLGDLHITIECPNGTQVVLKSYPGGGGTYLGVPIDIDVNLNPGVGWEYCWSQNPTYGTMNAESSSYSTLPSGSYATIDPLSNLVGCPLNGSWTIEVTDNLLSDNGYIFEWGINFNPNILPTNWTFTPDYPPNNQQWGVSPSWLSGSNGSTVVIYPDTGLQNIQFTVTDDYGCSYDTSLNVQVIPTILVDFGPDVTLCSDETLLLDATNNGNNTPTDYIWHTSYGTTATGNTFLVDKPGTYWVEIPNLGNVCGHTDTITVDYNDLGLELGSNITGVCYTNPQQIGMIVPNANNYIWSTGETTETITVTQTGMYEVTVIRNGCAEIDDIYVEFDTPLNVDIGDELLLCSGSVDTLYSGFEGFQYEWHIAGSSGIIGTSSSLIVSNPNSYYVKITNACGVYSDTINVLPFDVPNIDLGPDISLCDGDFVLLNAESIDASYLWSDGSIFPVLNVSTAGFYEVLVTNKCGTSSDQIFVEVDLPISFELGNDTTICHFDTLILDTQTPDESYLWSNSETSQSISVIEGGTYSVTITNACGSVSDYIIIEEIPELIISLGADTTICSGDSIVLNAGIADASYIWSNGEIQQNIVSYPVQETTYSVTVSNQCETSNDNITVSVFTPVVELGNDTSICTGESIVFDAGLTGASYLWSTGETTKTISADTAGTYSVEANHLCGIANGSISLSLFPLPEVELGNDTILGIDQSIVLDAGVWLLYDWSTGDTSQTLLVDETGTYSLIVTDENGCKAGDYINITILSSNSDISLENIKIYPNPHSDKFYVESLNSMISEIEVSNAIGKLVLKEIVNNNKAEIKLHHSGSGLYFVQLRLANQTVVNYKVLKE